MTGTPTGPILDGLGVTFELSEGDLIADALVIAKVVDSNGDVSVMLGSSEHCSWLDQLGLLTAASGIIGSGGFEQRDD